MPYIEVMHRCFRAAALAIAMPIIALAMMCCGGLGATSLAIGVASIAYPPKVEVVCVSEPVVLSGYRRPGSRKIQLEGGDWVRLTGPWTCVEDG